MFTDEEFIAGLSEFYATKYAAKNSDELPKWIYDDYEDFIIDDETILIVVIGMANGRTCGEDLLVVEMIKALNKEERSWIIDLFQHETRKSSATWDDQCIIRVRLLRKVLVCKSLRDFRPISIIPVFRKILQGILWKMTEPNFEQRNLPQCAFTTRSWTLFIFYLCWAKKRMSGSCHCIYLVLIFLKLSTRLNIPIL